ncbi:MAG: hypothetical protein EI684_21460 [Candidatus Viridilinea halotolerans]|uniref:Uncharacterized protein n=1 Tax=Candidatus Viridilinea halotolerans TaxID=2491704 RepID=A0A426TRG0_9CHLR|nr:MAG: hypothetical protein EI684_21460 [Candidatus Viridilinea halotolerans]
MNLEQTTRIITQADLRITHHRQQIAAWYESIPTNDPYTAATRQKVATLLKHLNHARLAVSATRIAASTVEAPNLPLHRDLERMLQDVDHLIAALNTVWHRIEAKAKTMSSSDPKRAAYLRLVAQVKTARMACLRVRETGLTVTPLDYRPDELLF